jgi:response regulator of citrate/malate metabolism
MIRVLIVEDDFMVARVHAGFVQRTAGFTVAGVAHTGAEAVDAVAKLRPDLVLLDIYLPDMPGITVLQKMRQSDNPDVDVIVVTAARDVDTVKKALHGGVTHYLVKPFTYDALRERLQYYARRRTDLATISEADQEDVDRVFGPVGTSRVMMPKGLTAETAKLVRAALSDAGDKGLSAAECAVVTGLSRVSARRYLEYLVAGGHAEVRSRYGSAGRPERRFRWTGS